MTRTTKLLGAALTGALLAAACHNDELFRPANTQPIDPLFTTYVAMGNSITAGFQSAGINDSTQLQSYAPLLAKQMHTPFFMPLMNRPGCPPPIDTLFRASGTPHRVGGGTGTTCALRRAQPIPPPYISDVAVPGALAIDGTTNSTNSNVLTTLILGGLMLVIGYQMLLAGLHFGAFGAFLGVSGSRTIDKIMSYHSLEMELLLGLVLLAAGIILGTRVLLSWGASGFGALDAAQNAMMAMILSILGIQTIFSGMFISLLLLNNGHQED